MELNPELPMYISKCIRKEKLSLKEIAERIPTVPEFHGASVSAMTIYNWIHAGKIPHVTRVGMQKDTVKVVSGGQILLPKWLRDRCDLTDGDLLLIEATEDGRILLTKKDAPLCSPFGKPD